MAKGSNRQLVEGVLKDNIFANGLLSYPALAIGSSKPNVASSAFMFVIGGVIYSKAAVSAGTAPGNDVIPQSKYGACAFDIGINGTIDAIEAPDNADPGYDSSALALAALPDPEEDHIRIGTVTATKSDGAFTFGTTNLDAANSTVAYADSDVGISFSEFVG